MSAQGKKAPAKKAGVSGDARMRAAGRPPSSKVFFIEVLQNGISQVLHDFRLDGAHRRRVRLGSGHRNDLSIPLSRLPSSLDLFEISPTGVGVLLDPRFEGFINNGREFRDVKEYLAPRGALTEVATVSEPLFVPLLDDCRGVLRFKGFEILFRVGPRPAERPVAKTAGLEREVFVLPEADVGFERVAPLLALLFSMLILVPAAVWLFRAPVMRFDGLAGLPSREILTFLHPSHLRLLPRVFGESFNEANPAPQALLWVSELERRWTAAERNLPYEPDIDFLGPVNGDPRKRDLAADWTKRVSEVFSKLEQERKAPGAGRFYEFQKDVPRLFTVASGGTFGSARLELERKLDHFALTQKALVSIILSEHKFLEEYLNAAHLEIDGLFESPHAKTILGPKPDDEYGLERERFAVARAYARLAQASDFRQALEALDARAGHLKSDSGTRESGPDGEAPIVWLSQTSLVVPTFLGDRIPADPAGLENLISNVRYAVNLDRIPSLPPAKASIDRHEVELVIASKRQEVRTCYESALRRDPKAAGTVRWRWRIDENGRVGDIRVQSRATFDKDFLYCIQSRIRSWHFPHPRVGARPCDSHGALASQAAQCSVYVTYPFRFVVAPADPAGLQ